MQAAEIPQDKLDQFISITGADKGRAGFFLEANNLDVEQAVSSYFESGAGATSGNIRTMGNNAGNDDDEEDGQEFYAGGVNKDHGGGSSVNVVGPNKKKAKVDKDKLRLGFFS